MKTQITKQHTNVVAVQPLTTFHKEDRMKKQRSSTLKLAILFAMVVTMTLSAMAQDTVVSGANGTYYNPLQIALKAWYPANQAVAFKGTPYNFNSPGGLAFDGSNMWVANGGSNTVEKIRASDGQLLGTYAAGSGAGGLAFDGVRMWVANHTSNTVTVLNASNGATSFTVTVGQGPNAMAWDGWAMWVTSRAGTVSRIDNWGGTACTYPGSGGIVYGVAWDGGIAWIADYTNDQLIPLDYLCHVVQGRTVQLPAGSKPVGVVYDGTNLWTVNSGTNKVSKIVASSGAHSEISVGASPWDVGFDGANIWVTNYNGSTVSKILAATGVVSGTGYPCYGIVGPHPLGIAFDGAFMWVSCPANNAVGKM